MPKAHNIYTLGIYPPGQDHTHTHTYVYLLGVAASHLLSASQPLCVVSLNPHGEFSASGALIVEMGVKIGPVTASARAHMAAIDFLGLTMHVAIVHVVILM